MFLLQAIEHFPSSPSLTLTAETVRPALVVPMPVVSTERGISFTAYFRNWDFPVPASQPHTSAVKSSPDKGTTHMTAPAVASSWMTNEILLLLNDQVKHLTHLLTTVSFPDPLHHCILEGGGGLGTRLVSAMTPLTTLTTNCSSCNC